MGFDRIDGVIEEDGEWLGLRACRHKAQERGEIVGFIPLVYELRHLRLLVHVLPAPCNQVEYGFRCDDRLLKQCGNVSWTEENQMVFQARVAPKPSL